MSKRWQLEEEYDYFLDEQYELLKIGDSIFSASRVLKKLDPIAYREGYWDYLDSTSQVEEDDLHSCHSACSCLINKDEANTLDAAFFVNQEGFETVWQDENSNSKACVVRNGEMRINYGDKILRYTSDLIENGITTDTKLQELLDGAKIESVNNAWFEVWTKDEDDYYSDPIHDLATAIEIAKEINKLHLINVKG